MVPYWFITQAKANHVKQDHLTVLLLQTSKHLSYKILLFTITQLIKAVPTLFSHTQQIVTHGLITSLCLALYSYLILLHIHVLEFIFSDS